MNYKEMEGKNQTALKKILIHPQDYLNEIKRQQSDDEIEKYYLVFGSLVDFLVLDSKSFDDHYYVFNGEVPGEKVKLVIDKVAEGIDEFSELSDYRKTILNLADTYEYQTKWKNDTRVDKIISQGTEYFNALKKGLGKTIISMDTYNQALMCKMALQSDTYIGKILKHPNGQSKIAIQWKYADVPMKSEVDFAIIDHDAQVIRPFDLKSTGSSIAFFKNSAFKFGYDFQEAAYVKALKYKYPGYIVEPMEFIAVEREMFNKPMKFRFDAHARLAAEAKFDEAIERLKFHQETGNWDYPMEYYKENGIMIMEDERLSNNGLKP
jgi:hypothetical protein